MSMGNRIAQTWLHFEAERWHAVRQRAVFDAKAGNHDGGTAVAKKLDAWERRKIERSDRQVARELRRHRALAVEAAVRAEDAALARIEFDAKQRIDAALQHYQHALAASGAAQAAEHYAQFKCDHLLTRDYEHREVMGGVGLFAAAFSMHGAFDAILLWDSQGHGGLGALLTAACLAAGPVVCGGFLGYAGLRFIGHVRPSRIIAGFVATGLGGIGGVASLLFTGTYRDLAATATQSGRSLDDVQTATVVHHLLTHPGAPFASGASLGLLCGGLVAAAVAIYDAYCVIDDPYPGFGRIGRRLERARATEAALSVWLRDSATEILGDAEQLLATRASTLLAVGGKGKRILAAAGEVVDRGVERRIDVAAAARTAAVLYDDLSNANGGHGGAEFTWQALSAPPIAAFDVAAAEAAVDQLMQQVHAKSKAVLASIVAYAQQRLGTASFGSSGRPSELPHANLETSYAV